MHLSIHFTFVLFTFSNFLNEGHFFKIKGFLKLGTFKKLLTKVKNLCKHIKAYPKIGTREPKLLVRLETHDPGLIT